jgi:hypothetical protein
VALLCCRERRGVAVVPAAFLPEKRMLLLAPLLHGGRRAVMTVTAALLVAATTAAAATPCSIVTCYNGGTCVEPPEEPFSVRQTFEDIAVIAGGGRYMDTGSLVGSHELENNRNQPIVTNSSGDVTFYSRWTHVYPSTGMRFGAPVGVRSVNNGPMGVPSRVFAIANSDGRFDVDFKQTVFTSGDYSFSTASLKFYVAAAGWDNRDQVEVVVDINSGDHIVPLFRRIGRVVSEYTGPFSENSWFNLTLDVEDYAAVNSITVNTVTIRVSVTSSDASEAVNIDDVVVTAHKVTADCLCIGGYDGADCSIDIDWCISSPCSNGGFCSDVNENPSGSFACTCAPGYTGEVCESTYDVCVSSPCSNGGTCSFEVGLGGPEWSCTCPTGYTGSTCVSMCDVADPCDNGGVCSLVINGASFTMSCACPPQYTGATCSVEITSCMSSPCQNGGSCTDTGSFGGAFTCDCLPGYEGATCVETIECASSPCANGGTCTDLIDGFRCTCASVWGGEMCLEYAQPCKSSPCNYGGICSVPQSHEDIALLNFDMQPAHSLPYVDANQGSAEHELVNAGSSRAVVATFVSGTGQIPFSARWFNTRSRAGIRDAKFLGVVTGSRVPLPVGQTMDSGDNGYLLVGTDGRVTLTMGDVQIAGYRRVYASLMYFIGSTTWDSTDRIVFSWSTGSNADVVVLSLNGTFIESQGLEGSWHTLTFPELSGSASTLRIKVSVESDNDEPVVVDSVLVSGISEEVSCLCPPGTSGDLCETDLDECASQPCSNGGSCSEPNLDEYECACVPGYTGDQCEVDIEECMSSPCYGAATCTTSGIVNAFRCVCPVHMTGTLCDVRIDQCASSPCLNGGSCSLTDTWFVCACRPGYSGTLCETDIDECASSPCRNGVACVESGVDQFRCLCNGAYEGLTCENDIDECLSSPCVNGGTCTNTFGSFVCLCRYDFEGQFCQTLTPNPCELQPCANGGTCVRFPNAYRVVGTSFENDQVIDVWYRDRQALASTSHELIAEPRMRLVSATLFSLMAGDLFFTASWSYTNRRYGMGLVGGVPTGIARTPSSIGSGQSYLLGVTNGLLTLRFSPLQLSMFEELPEYLEVRARVHVATATWDRLDVFRVKLAFLDASNAVLSTVTTIGLTGDQYGPLHLRGVWSTLKGQASIPVGAESVEMILESSASDLDEIIYLDWLYVYAFVAGPPAYGCECPNGWQGTLCDLSTNSFT